MSATVFISHSSADRSAAAEICAELEQRGVGCWIALRDISPGANFGEAITSAMSMARIMVLVFSRNADRSDEIKKEVVLAGQHGLVVIPLRIEDVLPSGALQYELSTRQWVDMFADRTAGLERLVRQVEQVVAAPKAAEGLVALPVLPAAAERVSIPVEAGSPEFAQAAAPAPAEKPDQHNLPHEATAFIGRETELLEIDGFLQQRRRVTLVGSGGVGKTRLALRVGVGAIDRFRDGVWLVELAPLAEASLVAEAVCRVISAPVSGARPAVDVAVSFLRQKNLLLVLDNCEHLLGGAAELTSALIAHCPGVSILATSREPLKIPGEVVYKVSTLPVPGIGQGDTAQDALRFASVRLLVQRAADSGGFYRFSDADAPSVSKICRRLDGVAMAIELAAARMTVLKVKEIALRLENAFRLLNSGGKSSLPRHQTLWATIDWSHSLLSPDEQMLLRRLSVYVDGFSLDGATAAAQGDGLDADDVLDLLDLLVDKSLVTADMSGVITRYRMLEATRHYAREKLKASGETGRDRLASAYLAAFCRRAEATWPTTPTEAWLAEFAPEVENLRSAIDWAFGRSEKYHAVAGESGDPVLGVELVAYACSIAEEMSLQADMKRWTATALQHLTPATPPDQAGWVFLLSTRWGLGVRRPCHIAATAEGDNPVSRGRLPKGPQQGLAHGRHGDLAPWRHAARGAHDARRGGGGAQAVRAHQRLGDGIVPDGIVFLFHRRLCDRPHLLRGGPGDAPRARRPLRPDRLRAEPGRTGISQRQAGESHCRCARRGERCARGGQHGGAGQSAGQHGRLSAGERTGG